jgi:tight adherence protein C
VTTLHILFLGAVFAAGFIGMLGLASVLAPRAGEKRLKALATGSAAAGEPEGGWTTRISQIAGPLAKLSLPAEGWEKSNLRLRFMRAGFRRASAPAIYFGLKTLLAILLPLLLFVAVAMSGAKEIRVLGVSVGLLLAAVLGYYLPTVLLNIRIARRQRDIFEALPDALDLLIVCVEAGLALDAAIARVSREISLRSPALSEELHLVGLEIRAGASRNAALRNLALRTGVEDVDALVAMLTQADRFGTSIADSLRVQGDMLRTKRQQRAEEAAAKIPLKLLFPLIFCIFPALLLVLLGPAFIQIYRILLPTLTGGN